MLGDLNGSPWSDFYRVDRGSTVGQLLLKPFRAVLVTKFSSCFILTFNLDLFVCCCDPLMGKKSFTLAE